MVGLMLALLVVLSTPSAAQYRISSSRVQIGEEQSKPESPSMRQDTNRLENELIKRGIEPTQQGIREYLQEIHPNDEQQQIAYDLIQQLGNDSFAIREKATQALFRMPALPVELLENASLSGDPEIAWRAKGLLELGKVEFGNTLLFVLQYVAKKEVKGLSAEVIGAIPLCMRPTDKRAAQNALLATFDSHAKDLLLRSLDDADIDVRRTTAYVVSIAMNEEEQQTLRSILSNESEDEFIRISAAEGLANLGARDVLPRLIDLLSANEVVVRVRSSVILRQLTGETFRYAAYDKLENREASIEEWRTWLASDGQTAELTFPLELARVSGSYLNGNTLLAMGYNNRVIELDPSGNEVFSVEAMGAWMAERLESGNTLVAAYSANQLVEYSPDGEVVWRFDAPSILSARPLENGNVLMAQHSPGIIREVTRNDEVVWEYTTTGSACDAIRLENGNTLIAFGNQVDEVTPENEVVWTYQSNQIYGISVVPNGNVIVSQLNGTVAEVERASGDVIWSFQTNNPVDAIRLPNGNTLVTANDKFQEVTPEGEVVWEKAGCSYGSARR